MLGGEWLRRNERSETGHTEGFGHLANPTGEKKHPEMGYALAA